MSPDPRAVQRFLGVLAAAALLAAPAAPEQGRESRSFKQLASEAGQAELPAAPEVPAPREFAAPSQELPAGTVACTMTFVYSETVYQLPLLPIVRLWKELDGIAKVACAGSDPVRLRMRASGLSLGLGIPNGSPFSSAHEGVAGAVEVRLPAAFAARQLEGEYLQVGGEVGGVGAGLSPWLNKDASLQMVLYLPTSMNASAAINLQKLELYLLPSDVDW